MKGKNESTLNSDNSAPSSPGTPSPASSPTPSPVTSPRASRRKSWCPSNNLCKFCKDYQVGGNLRQACLYRPQGMKTPRRKKKEKSMLPKRMGSYDNLFVFSVMQDQNGEPPSSPPPQMHHQTFLTSKPPLLMNHPPLDPFLSLPSNLSKTPLTRVKSHSYVSLGQLTDSGKTPLHRVRSISMQTLDAGFTENFEEQLPPPNPAGKKTNLARVRSSSMQVLPQTSTQSDWNEFNPYFGLKGNPLQKSPSLSSLDFSQLDFSTETFGELPLFQFDLVDTNTSYQNMLSSIDSDLGLENRENELQSL